jgi:hypothetical protein
MTSTRHRNAWIWVAIAAMAVATLSRAQAGIQNASAYTNPVLEFLAGHPSAGAEPGTDVPRFLQHRSRQPNAVFSSGAPGAWNGILPVLFIGLVAPLSLIRANSIQSLGRTLAVPVLPFRFQRPPPSLLF